MGGDLTHLKQGPGATPLLPREQEVTSLGAYDVRLAHWLKGKPAEGNNSLYPFDKLSGWRCSDLKMRTITSWEGQSWE